LSFLFSRPPKNTKKSSGKEKMSFEVQGCKGSFCEEKKEKPPYFKNDNCLLPYTYFFMGGIATA
jgi:hypothetical protein